MMLDRLYTTADTYMKTLADKSGGQLLRADDITDTAGRALADCIGASHTVLARRPPPDGLFSAPISTA